MPKSVAAEMLASEPSRDHDDMVSQSFLFEHSENDHAGPDLAVIVLYHLLAADEAPRIMRGFGEPFVALEFGHKDPGLVA